MFLSYRCLGNERRGEIDGGIGVCLPFLCVSMSGGVVYRGKGVGGGPSWMKRELKEMLEENERLGGQVEQERPERLAMAYEEEVTGDMSRCEMVAAGRMRK